MSSEALKVATSIGTDFRVTRKGEGAVLEFMGRYYRPYESQGPPIQDPGDSLLLHIDGKSTAYVCALREALGIRLAISSSISRAVEGPVLDLVVFEEEEECQVPEGTMEYEMMGQKRTTDQHTYYSQAVILLDQILHARETPKCFARFKAHSPVQMVEKTQEWMTSHFPVVVGFKPVAKEEEQVNPPEWDVEGVYGADGELDASVRMWKLIYSVMPSAFKRVYVGDVVSAFLAAKNSPVIQSVPEGNQDLAVVPSFLEARDKTNAIVYTALPVACPPLGYFGVRMCRNRLFTKGFSLSHVKSMLPKVPLSNDMRIDHLMLGEKYSVHDSKAYEHVSTLRQMGHEVRISSPYARYPSTDIDDVDSIQMVSNLIVSGYVRYLDLATSKKFRCTVRDWGGESALTVPRGTFLRVPGHLSGVPRKLARKCGSDIEFGYLVMRSAYVKIRDDNRLMHVRIRVDPT